MSAAQRWVQRENKIENMDKEQPARDTGTPHTHTEKGGYFDMQDE